MLGIAAKFNLFGAADPIGQYVKVNEQWFRVIGVVSPQLSAQTEVAGVPTEDPNNVIYIPFQSAILRLEDAGRSRQEVGHRNGFEGFIASGRSQRPYCESRAAGDDLHVAGRAGLGLRSYSGFGCLTMQVRW